TSTEIYTLSLHDALPIYVEKFAGIAGNKDGLKELPDGDFLPGFPLNAVEDYFAKQLKEKYPGRYVISGRCAHLSEPGTIHYQQGRGRCLSRTAWNPGCPLGGYYSSNSSTLPWAERTGRMTVRPCSVGHSIIYDESKGKATGVRAIDSESKERREFYARIIFVNAGSLNSNLILLKSTSDRFPNGLGNDNGLLGKYIAFHNYSASISAEYEGFKELTTDGRRPTGGYVPRFRNVFRQETDFLRGYAAGFSAYRSMETDQSGFGTVLKDKLLNPRLGPWRVGSHMMGETIPKESNHVRLDSEQKDPWGIPLLRISVSYDENDRKLKKDYHEQFQEMFHAAGFTNIRPHDQPRAPGLDIHEM